MMEVTLTETEQKIATYIGKLRHKNDLQNPKSFIENGKTQEQINIDGYCAEIAFAKMFNLYPDFTTQVRKGGYDFIRKNRTIDVKCSIHKPTWLTVKRSKKGEKIDYYVMLTNKGLTFEFAGWAYGKILMSEENLKDWGYGEGNEMYSLPPENLFSFSHLQSILEP